MLQPEDFNPENYRICWPAILAVFAIQMIVLIAVSVAVVNQSRFSATSSTDVKAVSLTGSDQNRSGSGAREPGQQTDRTTGRARASADR
jgi:hypothetical protein